MSVICEVPKVADILRGMRNTVGISQMELALRLGVSQRHVGFVELARARPSHSLIMSWSRETGSSVDARNAALLSAGYSPAFVDLSTGHDQDSPAFRALSDMLVAHDPNPGIIFDTDWRIRAMNEGGEWLCGVAMAGFMKSMDGPASEMDMIAATTHPEGLLSQAHNAAEAGFALLRQLRTEELMRPSLKPRIDRFEDSLEQRFGPCDLASARPVGAPYLQLSLQTEFGRMSFLLVQTVFALPQNVTHASLRTELWFPVDDATRRIMATGAAWTG